MITKELAQKVIDAKYTGPRNAEVLEIKPFGAKNEHAVVYIAVFDFLGNLQSASRALLFNHQLPVEEG